MPFSEFLANTVLWIPAQRGSFFGSEKREGSERPALRARASYGGAPGRLRVASRKTPDPVCPQPARGGTVPALAGSRRPERGGLDEVTLSRIGSPNQSPSEAIIVRNLPHDTPGRLTEANLLGGNQAEKPLKRWQSSLFSIFSRLKKKKKRLFDQKSPARHAQKQEYAIRILLFISLPRKHEPCFEGHILDLHLFPFGHTAQGRDANPEVRALPQ